MTDRIELLAFEDAAQALAEFTQLTPEPLPSVAVFTDRLATLRLPLAICSLMRRADAYECTPPPHSKIEDKFVHNDWRYTVQTMLNELGTGTAVIERRRGVKQCQFVRVSDQSGLLARAVHSSFTRHSSQDTKLADQCDVAAFLHISQPLVLDVLGHIQHA